MWAEVNGERKKVACGPCIRGHRSSKCDHRDRVLVEVRKPGRPLSSCPHPSGSCSCERVVINYTIPKSSECACPSERTQPIATVAGTGRIQKTRRKSTAINPSALEKAIKASQDAETDTSSYTRTPTERSASNEASPPSSASSTPQLSPKRNESISSCCQPRPAQEPVPQPVQGGCCSSSKITVIPEPVQVKSCCSSSKAPTASTSNLQPQTPQLFGQQFQFQLQRQMQSPQYQNMVSRSSAPTPYPFGLGAPIYNHAAAAYQQSTSIPMGHMVNNPMPPHAQVNRHAPEHNCHCGESCSCFGCAAHPNNATMMEYIRLMAQFQYTGGFGSMPPPLYDMPTYPHHPGFGAESHQTVNFSPVRQDFSTTVSISTPTQHNMPFPTSMNPANLSDPQIVPTTPWQQAPTSPTSPTNPLPSPNFHEPTIYIASSSSSTPITEIQPTLKTEDALAQTPTSESPRDSTKEETPTLSPSSYFWNQMVLPACDDATGTCQCGDGCDCVGCLMHGGHNGIQLEAQPLNEHDHHNHSNTFQDFANEAGLQIDDGHGGFMFDGSTA